MAVKQEIINDMLADYHTGAFSQRELAKRHGIGVATVNKFTKGVEPKNRTAIEQVVNTTRNTIIMENQKKEQVEQLKRTLPEQEFKAVKSRIEIEEKVLALTDNLTIRMLAKASIILPTITTSGELNQLSSAIKNTKSLVIKESALIDKAIIIDTNAPKAKDIEEQTEEEAMTTYLDMIKEG